MTSGLNKVGAVDMIRWNKRNREKWADDKLAVEIPYASRGQYLSSVPKRASLFPAGQTKRAQKLMKQGLIGGETGIDRKEPGFLQAENKAAPACAGRNIPLNGRTFTPQSLFHDNVHFPQMVRRLSRRRHPNA
jgi:hypothetical protein